MRGNIKGAGFYLYRPNAFGMTPSQVVARAKALGASWIAPRVVGWASPDPVNWDLMPEYQRACDEMEIELGGWGYHVMLDGLNFPPRDSRTGFYEPEMASEAINKWGLSFYVVNSEHELKAGTIPWDG